MESTIDHRVASMNDSVEVAPLGIGLSACIMTPKSASLDILEWAAEYGEAIRQELLERAILLRGFDFSSESMFQQFADIVCEAPVVFRSNTQFPSDLELPWHNEGCPHNYDWPTRVFFCCGKKALDGGQTPILNCAALYNTIDPGVREKFVTKGLVFVQNFYPELGVVWQKMFGTDKRDEVEKYCKTVGVDCVWGSNPELKTITRRAAALHHPKTGQPLWYNSAHIWHISAMDPSTRNSWRASYSEDKLPANSFFGDGSPIPDEDIQAVAKAARHLQIVFDWQEKDVLMLDNMLFAHGRKPFKGERSLHVACDKLLSYRQMQTIVN